MYMESIPNKTGRAALEKVSNREDHCLHDKSADQVSREGVSSVSARDDPHQSKIRSFGKPNIRILGPKLGRQNELEVGNVG